MLSAIEAAKIQYNMENGKKKDQLGKIELEVRKAAEKGEAQCWVSFWVIDAVCSELQRLGYVYDRTDNQRDGASTKISWSGTKYDPKEDFSNGGYR